MEIKEIRKWGIILSVILSVVGTVIFFKDHVVVSKWFWGISGVVLLMAIIAPLLLTPIYKFMMFISHYIGLMMTTIILGGIFYSIFTQMGIFLRLIGKDLLDRKINKDVETYWLKREKYEFNKNRYEKQF